MLKFIFILSLAILLVPSTYGQEKKQIKWHINYNEVTELAKKENKLVLLLFHGSNWCPPCIKMQNEVFAADTFISNVSEKILFLDVDFRTKPKLSEAQLTHNKEVKKRFSLPDDFSQGYPQVIIINGKGEVQYQEKGYDGRGPAYLMGKIDNLLKSKYLEEAKKLLPELSHQTSYPTQSIKIDEDVQVWLGWKAKIVSSVDELAKVKLIKGDTLILDFGRNMVGYLQGVSTGRAKMQIEPAEVLAELGDSWEKFPASFDNGYKPTRTWSPKVFDIQNNWRCSERLTFRYVRLVILEATDEIVLSKLNCDEVSAVPLSKIKPLEGFSPKMQQIDLVAQYTLRNCIQEVFEDGPKRDQRLWLGDLRLQAMLDELTFKSDSIVKRCILLFAGTQREDGFISSCVYNTSTGGNPEIGDEMIPDYAMLFGSTLLNYAKSSNDLKLAKALYPVACQQVDLACSKWLSAGNYLEIPNNIWMLIDWSKDLDRQAAEQATLIYAINTLSELATMIGLPKDANKWVELNKKLKVAAIEKYFDKQKGLFVSGPQHQVSWATQIWMILAGVVDKNEGARILKNVAADPSAIKPGCPYLVHHLVEAYLVCNMDTAAYQLIDSYWGGMIDKGATTFWEIYDPENPYKSPYNSHLFNSYCHAWSCTPAWFLRHPVYGKRLKKIDMNH